MALLGIGGYVVAGIFAFYGFFNKSSNDRRKENENLTSDLIKNLDRKVLEQINELNLLRNQIKDHALERESQVRVLQDEMKSLIGKNELLEKLFQGRDPTQQEMLKEVPEMFAIARENHQYSKANNAALVNLTKVITEFIETLKAKV